MKRHLLAFLIYFISLNGFSQFTDDFSDGDFTANPVWVSSNASGNGVDFQVNSGELQSAGPAATATLSITTQNVPSLSGNEVVWEFKARYGFGPSSDNNIEIFLVSNDSDLSLSPQGYFIRLGKTGSDDGIDFFKTSSATALITDPNPSVATSINVRIRVTRDDLGNWLIEADPSGGTTFTTIGSVNDTEFVSGDFFGFRVEHSSTRNDEFFFDDVSVTATNTDITPPSITTIEVMEPNQLIVTYNESVETITSETTSNYSLDNGYGNPSTALKTSNNQVTLTFSTDFIEANYNLTINNVEDLNGNAINTEIVDFIYVIPDIAELRDVIINEIFADPDPVVGLPAAEFVEIYNRSDKTFDLANWTFSDATSSAILPTYNLLPDGYVILTSNANADLFTSYGDVISMSNLSTLNNPGDQLTLKNENDELIDFVDYSSSWYQNEDKSSGGYTLELINPNNVCGGIENWAASNNAEGGTPGSENSIIDLNSGSELPFIVQALPISSTELSVIFSEPLDSTSLVIPNFNLPGFSINQLTLLDPNQVSLQINPALQNSTTYTLTINGALDCTGNGLSPNSINFQYIENPDLSFKDVIITEIMANPNAETSLPNAEYLEIYNRTNNTLILNNWSISDASSTSIFPYFVLDPNNYAILTSAQNAPLFDSDIDIISLTSLPSLNNSGDVLTLKNEVGVLLDSVNYTSSWYRSSIKDDGGFSLEIIDLNDPCSDNLNWIATEDETGGTPGKQNSVFSEISDNQGPEIVSAIGLAPDTILVTFNELLDANSIETALITLSNNLEVERRMSEDLVNMYVILSESTPLQSGVSYWIEFNNLTDCPGNLISDGSNTAQFSLIEEAELTDLHINEILFNPRTGGVDFVELYNSSNKFINLDGWKLTNGEIIENEIELGTIRELGSQTNFIGPASYVAVTADILLLANQYPKSDPANYIEISSLPSYPNEEGLVVLMNKDSVIAEFFNYYEDLHNPLFNETDGVSLERVTITNPVNEQENWFSASSAEDFATPGYINSSSRSEIPASQGELTISPKVIVPDGDGIDDFTTISYSFDQGGYAITITILDVNGREIKSIAQNDFVNTDGFYIWDGSNNAGERVRVGYYIIYAEAFGSTGQVQEFKEKVVIGAKF
ncbi:lamin tail domain-containing protein [Fulvivirga lutea]|uniref:Lamin tail domain-containing protein n=1 Tax=Fulvivirga lutea TaxID=2810512 RepID=A0A974WH61_9BACT|nr:lamin tail domain-containing protein [Fulvivirga lutea]QSE98281.1 lamin tail domain-containing protein [Fulvivirga lutea]